MDNKNNKIIRYATLIIVSLILAAIDQLTKYLVIQNIELKQEIPVIGDAVVLTYIRNTGTAWSLLSGKTWFLIIVTFIVCAGIIYIYHNVILEDRFRALRVFLITIMGGAIGNMIDRVRLQYVIDFIYFKIINFPVFNFADICVTVSIFAILFLFIFKYKSEDFDIILGDKKKSDNSNTKTSDQDAKSENEENV